MDVQYSERICPEAECIILLERRFRPDNKDQRSIPQICSYLSKKYDIPLFEIQPLLKPLEEVESYVNANLTVDEDRLRFFFAARGNANGSLTRPLHQAIQSGIRYGAMSESERIVSLQKIMCQVLDVPDDTLNEVNSLSDLMKYLLHSDDTEDTKWVCTALYYSIDQYLEELDVILRKATGLFLEHLPDINELCKKTVLFAKEMIGDDPTRGFSNLEVAPISGTVTVYPCLMGFHGLSWDFSNHSFYFGVHYGPLLDLIQKYSDQSTSLVNRLKSIGDKSRLEILRTLKSGPCNGQDIAERVGLAPATISHHMNLLTNEGFVSTARQGTSVYYSLNSDSLRHFFQELEHCLL